MQRRYWSSFQGTKKNANTLSLLNRIVTTGFKIRVFMASHVFVSNNPYFNLNNFEYYVLKFSFSKKMFCKYFRSGKRENIN